MRAENYIKNWHDVVSHVLAEFPNEACGIVTKRNKFYPYPNLADDKANSFEITANALIEHDVKCILHSHTYDPKKPMDYDPRIPSKPDMIGQENSGLEWAIVITEGENVTQPIFWGDYKHRPPLMEREFIHSCQDCLGFMSDWYFKEYGLELPVQPRDYNWCEKGEDYFEDLYPKCGFVDASDLPEQRGDVTLYKIRMNVVNHIGVLAAPGLLAHHLFGRMPVLEPAVKWKDYQIRRIRHKTRMDA